MTAKYEFSANLQVILQRLWPLNLTDIHNGHFVVNSKDQFFVQESRHVISRNPHSEIDPTDVSALAQKYGMLFADLESTNIDHELLNLFPSQELFRESILPLARTGNRIQVAISDPLNLEALEELTSRTGIYLDAILASEEQIQRHLKNALGVGGGTVRELVAMSADVEALQAAAGDEIDDASKASSVVKLVNELILEAIELRASDIHIEPDEDDLSVRYRIDGMLQVQPMPPEIQRFRAAIVSRLKIMAKLNIAEKRIASGRSYSAVRAWA